MNCEHCQRPIADVFATDPEVRNHTTCPPGVCANCKTEMPYADLERVELADGEIDPDPDLLVCSDVFRCQVRTGERDPDDVPATPRRAPTGYDPNPTVLLGILSAPEVEKVYDRYATGLDESAPGWWEDDETRMSPSLRNRAMARRGVL